MASERLRRIARRRRALFFSLTFLTSFFLTGLMWDILRANGLTGLVLRRPEYVARTAARPELGERALRSGALERESRDAGGGPRFRNIARDVDNQSGGLFGLAVVQPVDRSDSGLR